MAEFMTTIDRSHGDLPQGLFSSAFRMLIWTHSVRDAIQVALAKVREQYPSFKPRYHPRLNDLL